MSSTWSCVGRREGPWGRGERERVDAEGLRCICVSGNLAKFGHRAHYLLRWPQSGDLKQIESEC